ncbi:ribosome biogenesis GTPase Der [Hydrogenimonas thermophila]|uniref:ribosome biogenesis GTPase Der n=1 Tax=Hydrogenimonas thermophila TaxID=223786 RepID=UPI0029373CBC|nr:ribosome biogenesis GTPase Der [Hydrogenimonas thermophila]WOE70595.1 ribosome biogenesis GTPase Der [Hydrogenimonas thermophila]WOE73113.1 ribosome biogenesis GTPase Der [Hydrogenimonas thermophila]
MKKIAILGQPNVGKSSLFNRFAKRRIAITSDMAGTTRDVKKELIDFDGKEAEIVDTGGIDESTELFRSVKNKAIEAAEIADIIIYMVNGKSLPDDRDKQLFYKLQSLGKPIALVINKIDNDKEEERAWEFSEFGAQNQFAISVSHNRRVGQLIEWIKSHLDEPELVLELDDEDDALENLISRFDESGTLKEEENLNEIGVAIIGRTNVGKSSLLNALLGSERAVVSDVAGTTIDPVDEKIIVKDKTVTFIDTAGLRRRGKIQGIERYALGRTRQMLEKADIALLVLDASAPLSELDEKIAGLVDEYKLGCIIVLNKWDEALGTYDEIVEELRYRFKFLSWAPVITVSAKSKKRVHKITDMLLKVYENYTRHIPTRELNDVIKNATIKHHIPSFKGKAVNILFASQYEIKPPKIALISNRPKGIHFSYIRYLSNQIRENFDLEGTPLILIPKKRGEREEDNSED